MKNAEFEIKHINQTVEDFQKDIHRFEIEYEGRTYKACCIGGTTIEIEYGIITETQLQIMDKIWYMIDIYEHTDAWPVPEGAQKIADDYCKEEFCQEVSE